MKQVLGGVRGCWCCVGDEEQQTYRGPCAACTAVAVLQHVPAELALVKYTKHLVASDVCCVCAKDCHCNKAFSKPEDPQLQLPQ